MTEISTFLSSEITNGLAFKLCGAIGVKTRFLLSGSTIGPPQLSEYPVDPVGVDTISPSAQYVFKYWPSSLASIVIKDVVFFLETVTSFNAYFFSPSNST